MLWGPGEEVLAQQVADACDGTMAPPTSLAELAALFRRCAVVVTNDTGPMHLAVACSTPTVALFKGGEPTRWGHAYDDHAVIPVEGRPKEEVLEAAWGAIHPRLDGAAEDGT